MKTNQITRYVGRTSTRTAMALAVSALVFGLSSLTPASADDAGRGAGCSQQARGDGHGEHRGKGQRMGHGHEMGKGQRMGGHGDRAQGMMRGLNLSEEQRDKMFELRHAAQPQHRELRKQMVAKRQAMRELTSTQSYDEAKVRALADELGKLTADAEVMRAQMKQSMQAILTDEQRAQLQQRMGERQRRGQEGGEHRGRGRGSEERGPRHG